MSDPQQKIRLLVVDDVVETRNMLVNLLYFEKDIEIIGSANTGLEGIDKARQLNPDIVLMDINMPDLDGIQAAERITQQMPSIAIIMMSVQGEQDYMRRAMRAGASEFLVKPFTGDELISAIRSVFDTEVKKRRNFAFQPTGGVVLPSADGASEQGNGKIISIFSPKGGVGRTIILSNLAVAVKKIDRSKRIALVDGSLFFGDISIVLDVPSSKTVSDLQGKVDQLDSQLLMDVMMSHPSGISVLLAPPKPEQAELIQADEYKRILLELRRNFDYVFVDTYPSLKDETQLAILDVSDYILTVMTLEMPSIKDVRLFLEVAEILEYPRDKIILILNRADSKHGLKVENIEGAIQHPIAASIVSSGAAVTLSINRGTPIVIEQPDNPFSRGIEALAFRVLNDTLNQKENANSKNGRGKAKSGGFLSGLFGGGKKK
jgi:pilus assembly protein CpaE